MLPFGSESPALTHTVHYMLKGKFEPKKQEVAVEGSITLNKGD
jgi:hypothetical protein